MNLFSFEVRRMQQAAANLMRRLAQLEIAANGVGMVEAHKIVGPDGPLDRKDRRLKSIVVTGKSQVKDAGIIYSIIREHLVNPTGREKIEKEAREKTESKAEFRKLMKEFAPDAYYVGLPNEFEALTKFLNEPVIWAHETKDNPGEGWYITTATHPMRNIANALMDYLWYFGTPGMLEHDPIALCPRCDALFLKTKSSQEFCSTNCRVAAWSKKQGKEYFRKKQQEYRASLQVLKDAKSSVPRRRRS